jgi:hypothetical protein
VCGCWWDDVSLLESDFEEGLCGAGVVQLGYHRLAWEQVHDKTDPMGFESSFEVSRHMKYSKRKECGGYC